jgi:hypothetical protein
MDLREIEWVGMDWIYLAQDRDQVFLDHIFLSVDNKYVA